MKDLECISFKVKKNMLNDERENVFNQIFELHYPFIKTRLEPVSSNINDDLKMLRSFLKSWYDHMLDYIYLEDSLQEGHWHQYYLEHRFPRFFLKATLIII